MCVLIFLNGLSLGSSPLNVIQLLWTNLIMDILASIALCTEPPRPGSDNNTRISRKDRLISLGMWRTILVTAAYELVVLLFFSYFGTFVCVAEPFNLITEPLLKDGKATNHLVVNTMIFHTFILMNVWNAFNARCIDDAEKNVFKHLFNNPLFWLIFVLENAVQYGFRLSARTDLGQKLFGVAELNFG